MNERNRNWYEAIELRHSRRKYVATPVEPEKLETLAELIEELNRSSDAWRITLVHSHDEAIFSGTRGGYGIINGARSYLAFIGAPDESERHEELGYIGEAVALEATHLGLGTCWVSGTFDPAAVSLRRRGAFGGGRCRKHRRQRERPCQRRKKAGLRHRAAAPRDRRPTQSRRTGGTNVSRRRWYCGDTAGRSVIRPP